MKLLPSEKRKLKKLLQASKEYEGIVYRINGGIKFDHLRKSSPAHGLTFHTHNKAQAHGGFDPPSRQDIRYLTRFARTGHFVVTHNGIYFIKVSCKIGRSKIRSLIGKITSMQEQLGPGKQYNAAWMKAVNSVEPRCLRVKFVSWSSV